MFFLLICVNKDMHKNTKIIPSGTKYNSLKVLEFLGSKNGKTTYLCECDCGNKTEAHGRYLRNGDKKSCGCQRGDSLRNDLTNQKFGRLTVIRLVSKGRAGSTKWECQCSCGNTKTILANSLVRGVSKSCGCLHKEIAGSYKIREYYEEIPLAFFNRNKRSAQKRNLEFNLTIEELWDIYIKQEKKCIYTKFPIAFNDDVLECGLLGSSANVDRIDSLKGYTKENCCLVFKDINFMKQNFSKDKFINYCKIISENFKEETTNTIT